MRKVELSLQERRRGRKIPSLMGKSELYSARKDGMILEILLLILSETDIIYLIM